ncbi:hypothetical protein [Diaminobutyricimonas sp. TR449]|uniref:hypothetical protein n=1 Tax=Diaminobutyricimonas sp. TR449 TaxID=2708076 RepID=UPI001423FB1E|nr:hypothetical protein [Diaminobutyricimonas sp. TR449]
MSSTFTLVDSYALDDLHTLLGRAARVEEGSVRLIADSGVLAVYVAVLYPIGLMDETPTVLGLRTFALAETATFDEVVPVRSLIERLERKKGEVTDPAAPVEMTLPLGVNTVTWTAITPPRGGWERRGQADASVLDASARAGIDQVAAAVPNGAGEQIVHKVRSDVWGRGIDGLEHVPAGAAFAAVSLGFLADDEVSLHETGPWTRLSTARGHVLVKRRSWSIAP